jgi:hypothetical protein
MYRTANEQTARLDLVRRQAAATEDLDYFVELPPGTTVTVNALTHTNNASADVNANAGDELAPSQPIYIGPLESFAVIEPLAQPSFFFRTAPSLGYTNRYPSALSTGGIALRSEDVIADETNISWRTIVPEELRQEPRPRPTRTSPTPEIPKATPSEDIDFDDTWTYEGTPIEDLCEYLQRRLLARQSNQIRSLIPRVLAPVKLRQEEGSAFSFLNEERTLGPGRTLIAPIEHGGHYVLVTAQAQPGERINIRVLDFMTWCSAPADRTAFYDQARTALVREDW